MVNKKDWSMMIGMGTRQAAAVELYLFDPAHDPVEWGEMLDGKTLVVRDADAAATALLDALNGCDDEAEGLGRPRVDAEQRAWARQDRDALAAVRTRVLKMQAAEAAERGGELMDAVKSGLLGRVTT